MAARRLRRLLPDRDSVVVIDRSADHVFAPSLPWVVSGARSPSSVRRALGPLLGRGVELIQAPVEHIDAVARTAAAGGRVVAADALIVSLGADLAPDSVPGLAQGGMNLYDVAGAHAFHDALRRLPHGRVVVLTATPAYKCPAAPYETALLAADLVRRSGRHAHVTIEMYAAEVAPMPVAGAAVGGALTRLLDARHIAYHPGRTIESVDAERRELHFAGGAAVPYDLLGFIPPHHAPAVVTAAGLAAPGGWIAVDRDALETAHPGVFAIGDVTTIPLAMGKPLPKAGVFAHRQADAVAASLAYAWTGKGRPHRFDGHGACFVEVGGGRAAYGGGNFYAEPAPSIALHGPSRWAHWSKLLYEQLWLKGFLVGLPA